MSGRGAFPVMEPPAADRQIQPQQYLDLLTVTFDKVKNSIGLSIIEAVVSVVAPACLLYAVYFDCDTVTVMNLCLVDLLIFSL